MAGPVYEFGAMQVRPEDTDADLRSLFAGQTFVGADFRDGPGVDRVLDLHDIDLPDGSVGMLISLDTLELVEYPRRAVEGIFRVLKPGGIAIIRSVMNFPIHGYPNDYWRFTPAGFRSLLGSFLHQFVGSCGSDPQFPQSVVGIGFKGNAIDMRAFDAGYAQWQNWTNSVLKALDESARA